MAVLFISEQYVKNTTLIDENVDVRLILPSIKDCQELRIHPILGTPLYEDLNTPGYIAELHALYEKANKGDNKDLFISACKFIGLLNESNLQWQNFKKIEHH